MELGPLPSPDPICKIAVGAHLTRVDGGISADLSVATASDHLYSFVAEDHGGLRPSLWAALPGRGSGVVGINIDNIPPA